MSGDLNGVVRVGATNTFNLGFIPDCVAMFLARYPGVKMVVEELPAELIGKRLRAGKLDLGIAYRPDGIGDLRFEPLYSEEMVLVVSEQHSFARRKRLRMIELLRKSLVKLPAAFTTRRMLDECFRNCKAEPVVVAEMSTIAPMLGLVARTAIGAIVAVNAVPAASGLVSVPLESPTPVRTPGILWRSESKQTIQIRSFATIVRKLARSTSLRPRIRSRHNEAEAAKARQGVSTAGQFLATIDKIPSTPGRRSRCRIGHGRPQDRRRRQHMSV